MKEAKGLATGSGGTWSNGGNQLANELGCGATRATVTAPTSYHLAGGNHIRLFTTNKGAHRRNFETSTITQIAVIDVCDVLPCTAIGPTSTSEAIRMELGPKGCSLSMSYILIARCHHHQENSNHLARLAPVVPDAPRLPYSVWRHIDARDARNISHPRSDF